MSIAGMRAKDNSRLADQLLRCCVVSAPKLSCSEVAVIKAGHARL